MSRSVRYGQRIGTFMTATAVFFPDLARHVWEEQEETETRYHRLLAGGSPRPHSGSEDMAPRSRTSRAEAHKRELAMCRDWQAGWLS